MTDVAQQVSVSPPDTWRHLQATVRPVAPSDPVAWGVLALLLALPLLAPHPSLRGAFVTCATIAGVGTVLLWWRGRLSTLQVLGAAFVLRLAFLPLVPSLTDDTFRYVWDGWMQWEGINPYRYAPSNAALAEWHDTHVYESMNSADYYSVYPPVSQAIFALGAAVQDLLGGSWHASYFTIKGVMVLLEGAALLGLARLIRPSLLVLYAWSPLVLLETAGQGHTEAALVFFLVATIACVRAGRAGWASVALAGAGLVKIYPFVLFPYLIRRFGFKRVLPGIAAAAVALLPFAAPYVLPHVKTSLDLYVRLFEFNAGPYFAVKEAARLATGADWSKVIGPAFRGAFLAALPVLYWIDARQSWSFSRAGLWTAGAFLCLSTTVHPWYVLGILPFALAAGTGDAPVQGRDRGVGRKPASGQTLVDHPPSWPWIWLSITSIGTYLLYTGGAYWAWVVVGWGGAGLLAARSAWQAASSAPARQDDARSMRGIDRVLQAVQRRRAEAKVDRLAPHLREALQAAQQEEGGRPRVLDLGAGEGYVAEAIERRFRVCVQLCDVIDLCRVGLPHDCYDGRTLPYPDGAFDVTLLYFVLHHAEDPVRVLSEALRVTSRRVIVVESVVTGPLQHRALHSADRLANRLRSAGTMTPQEEHLNFRPTDNWIEAARSLGARVDTVSEFPGLVHPQALLSMSNRGKE